MDELAQTDNPKTVTVGDAVQLDVMPADNDNKTFLVPLPQVPTGKKIKILSAEVFDCVKRRNCHF